MDRKSKLSLLALIAIGLALGACVESDQSVVMLGSVVGFGDVDDETGRTSCFFDADIEEANVRTTGFVDLNHLENVGQPVVAGTTSGGLVDEYRFVAVMENRLFDSRSVGAVSGGDGGGYENLQLDKNDILVTGATVRFDSDSNTFGGDGGTVSFPDIERERLTNMLVMSGGGSATVDVPIIANSEERAQFQAFLSNTVGSDASLTLIAEIQLHGETLAGNGVNSNIIQYPITMCLDCGRETDALCH